MGPLPPSDAHADEMQYTETTHLQLLELVTGVQEASVIWGDWILWRLIQIRRVFEDLLLGIFVSFYFCSTPFFALMKCNDKTIGISALTDIKDECTVIFCHPDPVLIFRNLVQAQPQSKLFFKCKVQVQMKSKLFEKCSLFATKMPQFFSINSVQIRPAQSRIKG